MATRVLLLFRLSLCCSAFSWPRQINTAGKPISAIQPEDDLGGLLANHAAFEEYSRRPDCFRRVAGKIRVRCGDLEMNENERVKAAISMTLCELATATHHSIPLECASFTVDSDVSSTQIQGACVDAFSRSAQFWSSYSGYLREVPQLCFAFRRWNDIDTAKDIYKNSTIETMNLIQLLLAREKQDLAGKKRWDAHLSELEEVATRLKTMSNLIDVVISAASPRFENELSTIVDAFKDRLADVQTNARAEHSQVIDQISSEFQLISRRVGILTNNLNNALSPFQAQSLQAFDVANSAQELWINLTLQFSTMQQTIVEVSNGVSKATATLEASTQLAQVVHDAQIAASLSASNLAETLTQLTTTTHESLEKFNASAGLLAQNLLPRAGLTDLLWLMEAVLRSSFSAFAFAFQLTLHPQLTHPLSHTCTTSRFFPLFLRY
ncbi:hypothetical protein B0H17DRAFT_1087224 [Mycena rosella]|uniref:Nuclear fusion protein KAR5 n=1 Tax=Mycena rosella TaxID=1033263 RepID=A0AAD7G9K6_MYCRO|nr:hypothetical protein B0H17DRAFT_1087224 [Mycena rosella]